MILTANSSCNSQMHMGLLKGRRTIAESRLLQALSCSRCNTSCKGPTFPAVDDGQESQDHVHSGVCGCRLTSFPASRRRLVSRLVCSDPLCGQPGTIDVAERRCDILQHGGV